MSAFRTAAGITTPPGASPIQAALELRAVGRLEEALQALSIRSEFSTDFYILRGDLQLELGQIQEAAESYSTVVVAVPDHVYAQGQLGMCLYRLERWEAAARSFEAVLQFDPHRDEVRLDLAGCHLRLHRYGAALDCFDRCWSEGARRRALFGKAVALQFLHSYEDAASHYERLLALDPRAEEALSNLIAMSVESFELLRVQKFSQRLLEINPRSIAALQGLALVAIERRDYTAAAGYFCQAAELAPEITQVLEQSDAVGYRISRKIFESLEETRRKQDVRAAHA